MFNAACSKKGQGCPNAVADLALTAWHGVVTHLVFGHEGLHHEFGCQILSKEETEKEKHSFQKNSRDSEFKF